MFSWVSPVVGYLAPEVSYPKTLPQITQRILWGLNFDPQGYDSYTFTLATMEPIY